MTRSPIGVGLSEKYSVRSSESATEGTHEMRTISQATSSADEEEFDGHDVDEVKPLANDIIRSAEAGSMLHPRLENKEKED